MAHIFTLNEVSFCLQAIQNLYNWEPHNGVKIIINKSYKCICITPQLVQYYSYGMCYISGMECSSY